MVGLLGSGIGILLVDRVGRRPLIIVAFAGLTLSLAVLALTGSSSQLNERLLPGYRPAERQGVR